MQQLYNRDTNAMSDKEKETFDTMAKDIAFFKRWFAIVVPVVLFLGGLIGMSIRGTLWFESNIARKSDIEGLTESIAKLNESFNNHVQYGNITKIQFKTSIDSLGNELKIVKSLRYVSATQHRDRYGNITYRNVN